MGAGAIAVATIYTLAQVGEARSRRVNEHRCVNRLRSLSEWELAPWLGLLGVVGAIVLLYRWMLRRSAAAR